MLYHAFERFAGMKGAGHTDGGLFVIATDIVGRPLGDAESWGD